ncbi:coiled-coil domain-containing protein 175 [Sorex fumeus]|uniref:coiled-coil domain-containing protein 175 n=1 Tax=Sorex fumeus TaxID=62283 RepID=UPI0024AD3682|nr:coiled-coil domain-containing protein 175 [Sorex fumeus]
MESDRSSRLALTPWTPELAFNEKPRETAVSTGQSLELCTYPESLGCAVATDALEQLFAVEKMLQDDYFKCNEEAKAFLKDVAVAVKKLEQMRKDTIDLLEMESMELSRLYFLLRTVPGKFHVELEDCVRDARKLNIFEKNGLQRKIFQLDNEERFLRKRLTELQEVNETLGETQENLAYEHQKIVMELNALLEEKAKMTVSINEIYVKINSAKKLLDLQKQCYKDVTDELERERSLIFQRKQILFDKIYKMKRLHDQKKAETFKMKGKFQALTRKMSEIKDKDTVGTESLTDHNLTILQLQETIKHWRQEVHNLKIFCRNLEEKKIYFVSSKMRLDTERNIEKADLLQKIKKVAEKLKSRRLEYQDLQERLQNLNKQYMAAIKEEEKIKRHQRMMILENEKLLSYITEKENFLFKRKVDIKNMTDGISTLRELLQATKQLYRKELKLLGDKLQREYERRFFTKWKVSCAKKKGKLWILEQSALLEKLINDLQAVQQTRKHLEMEISYKEREIADFLLGVKELVQKLKEDEEHFVDEENKLIEELTESQKTFVMEKHSAEMYEDMLQEYLPNLQEVEVEFINKNKKYEELCGQISGTHEAFCNFPQAELELLLTSVMGLLPLFPLTTLRRIPGAGPATNTSDS